MTIMAKEMDQPVEAAEDREQRLPVLLLLSTLLLSPLLYDLAQRMIGRV